MSNIRSHIRRIRPLLFIIAVLLLLLSGCSSGQRKKDPNAPPRDTTPIVHQTDAPGDVVYESNRVSIDASRTCRGYITLTYLGSGEKVKFQITTPQETTYTYLVPAPHEPLVFPLTGGSGNYRFTLLETVNPKEDLYAIVYEQNAEVQLEDEFLPYLTPNIYSMFHSNSSCVLMGQTLAAESYGDLDVIEHIYTYVTKHIVYDEKKAKSVSYGYTPVPDETLNTEKGICFDYASLMTAMLRSQRIPTKLEVGYAGEIYHAWISCYVKEIGWVDRIIEFDGEHWSLMDPTLAAGNNRDDVKHYMGDGSKYLVKYTY